MRDPLGSTGLEAAINSRNEREILQINLRKDLTGQRLYERISAYQEKNWYGKRKARAKQSQPNAERLKTMKQVNIEVKCSVEVAGERKEGKKTISYNAVESIPDASTTLVSEYKAQIDALNGADRPASLKLEGNDTPTPEQLASNFILDSINEKRRAVVYQPAYVALKNELLGPEVQIEKLANDIVKRASAVGRTLSLADAMEKARTIMAA